MNEQFKIGMDNDGYDQKLVDKRLSQIQDYISEHETYDWSNDLLDAFDGDGLMYVGDFEQIVDDLPAKESDLGYKQMEVDNALYYNLNHSSTRKSRIITMPANENDLNIVEELFKDYFVKNNNLKEYSKTF